MAFGPCEQFVHHSTFCLTHPTCKEYKDSFQSDTMYLLPTKDKTFFVFHSEENYFKHTTFLLAFCLFKDLQKFYVKYFEESYFIY